MTETVTKERKAVRVQTAQMVRQVLCWSEMQYNEYQMDMGFVYLKRIVGADDWGMKQLSESSIFWKWWINHWDSRDDEFLAETCRHDLPLHEWRECYFIVNNPDNIEYRPHKVIMEQSYQEMIGRVLDSCREGMK